VVQALMEAAERSPRYGFKQLFQVREMAWFWQQDDNQNRTHESLNNRSQRYTGNS